MRDSAKKQRHRWPCHQRYREESDTATIADDGVLFDCYDVSGNKIEEAADQHYSLSGTYRAPLGPAGWEWLGRLGVRHEGPQFIDIANYTELPGITTANGSVGFSNDNWQIIIFGNNLTDEDQPREIRGFFLTTATFPTPRGTTATCREYLERSGYGSILRSEPARVNAVW